MQEPKIKIKEVRGLSTILNAEPFPDKLLQGIRFSRKTDYYPYTEAAKKHLQNTFYTFFKNYDLNFQEKNLGMFLANNKCFVKFKKEVIMPFNEKSLDGNGYYPQAEIKINKKESEIKLKLSLKNEGGIEVTIIEELIGLRKLKGDGIKNPLVKYIDDNIYISGIQWLKPIINEAKRFYDIIGKNKLRELNDLQYTIKKETKDIVKNALTKEYDSQIKALSLPTKNF